VCLFVCFLPNVFSYDGRLGVELAKDMPVHKFERESGYDEYFFIVQAMQHTFSSAFRRMDCFNNNAP
jgi:hypothetical protein